jgi:hypothetical protein
MFELAYKVGGQVHVRPYTNLFDAVLAAFVDIGSGVDVMKVGHRDHPDEFLDRAQLDFLCDFGGGGTK